MKKVKIEKLTDFENMKFEIKLKAKNGIDFIFAASITWFGIFLIWRFLTNTSYDKSILTFMFGAILLPLAFGFSKIFKTNWKIKNNPLQPLGLWLNFAQLIYFQNTPSVIYTSAYAKRGRKEERQSLLLTAPHLAPSPLARFLAWTKEERRSA